MKVMHVCMYPGRGAKHVSESGVASYTKNLLTNMPASSNVRHFVLCARKDGGDERYVEDDIVIMRCFDKSFKFVWQIHKQLKRMNPDVVHIQHELALFGGLINAYLLSLLVFVWRRKVVVTLHGVLGLKNVNKDFVRANNYSPAPAWLVRLGLKLLYWPLVRWPQQVVVHEPHFRQILAGEYGARGDKVAVIPHGVEAVESIGKSKARRLLGIGGNKNVVLFMGYAAGYKGVDLLIEGFAAYAKRQPNALLLVGAGAHPKLKNDRAYLKTYRAYQEKAKRLIPKDQYRWVGFIPEGEVNNYYSAADVSLYPYTAALSSSGPMSFAIGHNKPFLASSAFAGVFSEDFIFDATTEALATKLQEFFDDVDRFGDKISKLRSDRLWSVSSLKTANLYKQIG